MARSLAIFPLALAAARGGMNATQFYNALREQGIAPRQSEAYKLFGIAKNAVAKSADEPFRPLGSVPTADELVEWPTKVGTGVSQRILLTYRDRATGAIVQSYYNVTSERGVTRESAIATAISAYEGHAQEYNQDLIGAIHMGAYQQVPFSA